VIEPTDEMVEAYGRAVWPTPRSKSDAETTRARRRAGLAAVLAIVERDRCMQPRGHADQPLAAPPIVHLAIRGDGHVHCCGRTPFELPAGDKVTLDQYDVTCKGPS
jgi:hypothetical protein